MGVVSCSLLQSTTVCSDLLSLPKSSSLASCVSIPDSFWPKKVPKKICMDDCSACRQELQTCDKNQNVRWKDGGRVAVDEKLAFMS